MCHTINDKDMVGQKKKKKTRLDIRPNVGGISAHFPNKSSKHFKLKI